MFWDVAATVGRVEGFGADRLNAAARVKAVYYRTSRSPPVSAPLVLVTGYRAARCAAATGYPSVTQGIRLHACRGVCRLDG